MKKSLILCVLLAAVFLLSSCSAESDTINEISQPDKIASGDEIYPAKNLTAVEKSNNVNGMRYSMTLDEFTYEYNQIMQNTGGTEYLNKENWIKTDDIKKDTNGVNINYYYYNSEKLSFTAAVEAESNKIMNIGCGTTTNIFVSQENNQNYSSVILRKSAVMAAAVCGFSSSSLDVLQDIFYRTTFEGTDSFWYEGSIFNLSINEDKTDSQKSTMLFRVFPVTDSLKKEWDVADYNTYIATSPTQESTAAHNNIMEN